MNSRNCTRTSLWLAFLSMSLAAGCDEAFFFDRTTDSGAASLAPCERDPDCALATLHCETASGACVECLEDDHCTDAAFSRCDLGARRCVQCLVSDDCDSGFICEPRTHSCVRGCSGNSDCPGDMECDEEDGFCESCEQRVDCAATPLTPVCEPRLEICVQCVSSIDCAGPTPRCDPVRARCVECADSSDCPAEHPFCDPRSLRCVNGTE